ncbi:MAG: glycosyl hydrolase family 88 [Segetibacter sp.]|nr:glycosyl hydrolase family 88 [Segetibacter sp.]
MRHCKIAFLLLVFVLLNLVTITAQPKKEVKKIIAASYKLANKQLLELHKEVPKNLFPQTLNQDGTLKTNKSGWWTSGFFPGSLWYLYKNAKDAAIKQAALERTKLVEVEKLNVGDHDIGFKIMCSFGNQLRIIGDTSAIPVIITAAQSLTKRFSAAVGAIRSWGSITDNKNFLVIIDNMMNLELLFAATRFSGDSSYYKIAVSHADKTMANHYRNDGSSYHVIEYNPATGAVTKKRTQQGYGDESAWARGQAWGLYGYVVCYRETKDQRYLDQANKVAQFLLRHPNLPKDKIPYWDFNAPGIPNVLRDASAGAIIASGLLELSKSVNKATSAYYLKNAEDIIRSLSATPYRTVLGESHNFLLKHSVGHLTANSEVDVPLSYADYYYLEATKRYIDYKKK